MLLLYVLFTALYWTDDMRFIVCPSRPERSGFSVMFIDALNHQPPQWKLVLFSACQSVCVNRTKSGSGDMSYSLDHHSFCEYLAGALCLYYCT